MQYKFDTKKVPSTQLLIIVLLLTLTNLSFIMNNNLSTNSPLNNDDIDIFNLPKTSAGEITIKTPENITYGGPMSGYYPASYGFENELEGTSGSAIEYVDVGSSSSNCEVKIYDEFQGHKKVLRIHDGNPSGNAAAQNNFASTQTTGSVEWWWSTTVSGSNNMAYHFHEGIMVTHAGRVLMQNDNFVDMEDNIVQSYVANQWYHQKVIFDTTSDTYDWYIDGILRVDDGNFLNPVTNIGSANIKGGWDSTGSCYVDAIGYEWDPNYDIAKNLNEGLLLSYENTTSLDWAGYSLDGQINKTILGNTTITLPDLGLHKIQVFGNNSLGTMYQSSIRYFYVSPINLISPENKTYFEPMNGYYPATYGFENDKIGDNPYGWTTSELGLQNIEIISSLDGHNNILELFDTEAGSVAIAQANNSFASQTSGTIEFWYRIGGTQEDQHFRVLEGVKYGIYFGLKSGNFKYCNISGWHTLASGNKDQWYHVRFDFDCTSDTYDFYLDNVLIQSNLEFYTPVNSLNQIEFFTRQWGTSSDFYSYVDALGYSWDSNYKIGDNLQEGLLLSFENGTTTDWLGYSLDNQANKTILGNTSINMPDLGLHKIQVFGNNSIGTMYQSSLRYFSVAPIGLTTPENTTYTEPMSGYYPATYGFENDTIGSEPSGVDKSVDAGCSLQVIGEIDGHKNVVEFDDQSNTGRAEFIIENSYWTASNTFEFYWRVTDASNYFGCGIYYNSPNQRAVFRIESDKFQHYDGTYHDVGLTASDNTWYHIKVIHTVANWYLHIDGIEYGSFGYQAAGGIMNGYHFVTDDTATNYRGYIDALGFDADINYAIGSNLNEGLLLSYSNTTNLEWVGYSLDGLANKTILGTTTVKIPDLGLHKIQLFGNNSLGTTYQSDLRYFTVDISEPTVSVITPQVNQYFGVNAPDFSVDIQGFNLDKWWYSLDNGITNISFMSFTGGISQSEWDKFAHEPVQINFYVKDSFSRIGVDVVTVNKDLNAPLTAIYFVPYSGFNRVISSTLFSLSATDNSESGVSTTQFKIGNSAWLPYTGAFTLSGYASGFYTITYQSIDAVGNIETEKTLVLELIIPIQPPENPNLIPLLLISIGIGIGAVLGITIFLLSRRRTPKTPIKARTDEKASSGSDQLKVCPFCYAQIKINNKYCTLCGASLEKD